ncbi:hypothetical protein SAMN05421879_101718 [Ornithinimicrobium cerasi]|uniref:Uncharacterized protein n=1 Tax=Ornithinimicrobium cerasi TaxID=2248773 RepID=A0A285VEU6_9MICO|nr:hypothetical protein SAMN05421879_101718 [Ornithinimicrobium cerasi]
MLALSLRNGEERAPATTWDAGPRGAGVGQVQGEALSGGPR